MFQKKKAGLTALKYFKFLNYLIISKLRFTKAVSASPFKVLR
jgi:hypothetical protein